MEHVDFSDWFKWISSIVLAYIETLDIKILKGDRFYDLRHPLGSNYRQRSWNTPVQCTGTRFNSLRHFEKEEIYRWRQSKWGKVPSRWELMTWSWPFDLCFDTVGGRPREICDLLDLNRKNDWQAMGQRRVIFHLMKNASEETWSIQFIPIANVVVT